MAPLFGIPLAVLIIANVMVSYHGFKDNHFLDRHKFEVDPILMGREYGRLFSSAFLHADWVHLIFNMLALYSFGELLLLVLGTPAFFAIYFAAILGGGLLSLFFHRAHGDYSAVGASGGVCGVIFAVIALFPDTGVGFFFIPVSIPGWLFALVFVGYSIYGIRSDRDDIGHDAHLGGALVGMAVALALRPAALELNYWAILILTVPTLAFLFLAHTRPHLLLIPMRTGIRHRARHYTVEDRYNTDANSRQHELDALLEKIAKGGIQSLSAKELRRLDELSKH